jgi:hypothetical protein
MENSEVLTRVKDNLRSGIEVIIGMGPYFHCEDTEYERKLREITGRYPEGILNYLKYYLQ